MARINIEDSLFKDSRFTDLCIKLGSRHSALGAFMEACILAQKHYLSTDNDRLIPLNEWQRNPILKTVVDVGLAEERDKGIYVSGSEKQFNWLIQRSNAGKKLKGARDKRPLTGVKRNVTKANGSKPLTPTLPLSPPLSQSRTLTQHENPTDSKPQAFVARYCDYFKSRWGVNPQIQGKDAGIAGRLAKGMGIDRFDLLLQAFFSMPDAWLVKTKHPLSAFETKLNEITVFADSGKFTTNREVKQADNMATNMQLLKKIEEGSV